MDSTQKPVCIDLHFCSNKILLLLVSVIFIFFYWLQTVGKSRAGDKESRMQGSLRCELGVCVTVVVIRWFLPSWPSIAGWVWEWDWPLFPRALCSGESLNDGLLLHEMWPRMHLSSWDPLSVSLCLAWTHWLTCFESSWNWQVDMEEKKFSSHWGWWTSTAHPREEEVWGHLLYLVEECTQAKGSRARNGGKVGA